ncbi:MAG: hypothetical protein ACE5KJ_07510, partial [Candidatus Zixiibacteriota bacterium]
MRTVAWSPHNLAGGYLLSMLLGMTGGMLLVWHQRSLFFFLGFFVLLTMFVYLLNNPIKGIILFLSAKCVFDMFWFIKLPIGDAFEINVQRVVGILFPLVILSIFI